MWKNIIFLSYQNFNFSGVKWKVILSIWSHLNQSCNSLCQSVSQSVTKADDILTNKLNFKMKQQYGLSMGNRKVCLRLIAAWPI